MFSQRLNNKALSGGGNSSPIVYSVIIERFL